MKRLLVGVAWLGSVLVAGLLGWWAAGGSFQPPTDPLADPSPIIYRIAEGEVGSSISLTALAEWPTTVEVTSWASGVVTGVPEPGWVAPGDVLYEVNERPVVAGIGDVPAYRDLTVGDEGDDVSQLQNLLGSLGFTDERPDGRFRPSLAEAVASWQTAIGAQADGVVRIADVVWFPELPTRVSLSPHISAGVLVDGGERIRVLGDVPDVWVPISLGLRNTIPDAAAVVVAHPLGEWTGIVTNAVPRQDSNEAVDLILASPDGSEPVCGDDCVDAIPLDGRTEFSVDVVVVPRASGPVVPSSAVTTRPDGSAFVTTPTGQQVDVEIIATEGSILLVKGVTPGSEVLLFGGAE